VPIGQGNHFSRMPDQPNILVVGSINMDMVVRCPRLPAAGQTVLGGEGFATFPGGKGANQAVAVARTGGNCRMIGCIGNDAFGQQLVSTLREEGIDTTAVTVTEEAATGVAMIIVDSSGENSIVVAGGANRRVTPDDNIYPNQELFEQADNVLLQLELPLPTVRAAANMARRNGCKVILDPAPAVRGLCDELCRVDVICPNVIEAELITGTKTGEQRADKNIASNLIARGAKAAVLKLGSRGSLVVSADGLMARVPAYKVDIVDTTGAGDAFTAALAVAIANGQDLLAAARFANAAGALTCTKLGAQSAMPTSDEIRILMEDQP